MGQVSYLEDIQKRFEDLENAVWKNLHQIKDERAEIILSQIDAAFKKTQADIAQRLSALPKGTIGALERNAELSKERFELERVADLKISELNREITQNREQQKYYENNLVKIEAFAERSMKENDRLQKQIEDNKKLIDRLKVINDLTNRQLEIRNQEVRDLRENCSKLSDLLRQNGIVVVDQRDRDEMKSAFDRM